MAAASLAGYRLGAGASAGAGAGFARHRGRHTDAGGLAAKRLFERDLEVVAQIGAALPARGLSAAPSAHHVAEKIIEDVGHRGREAVVHAALIERGVTIAIVGRALLGVRQMLVGFVELLEPRLGLLVAGMPVGVTLHRRLAEGGLEFSVARRLGNAKSFVEIALGHRSARPQPMHASDLLLPRRFPAHGPVLFSPSQRATAPSR